MSAEAELKQFIDRILRLKEEQDTLGEDIREVYAEAKGRGYDKTVLGNVVSHLRKVAKLGNDTLSEREEIFDLYLTAYETGGRAPASARTRENIEEFPVDARLVATVANAVQTETGRKALIAAVDIMIEREERIDPETGEILDDTVGGDDVDRSAMRASSAVEIGATNSPETATPTRSASTGAPETPGKQCTSVVSRDEAGQNLTGKSSNFEPPAFLAKDQPAKTMRDYRPHCQNPDACAASGLKHCYSCSKLMAVESEVA